MPAREVRINGNLLIYHHTLLDTSSNQDLYLSQLLSHTGETKNFHETMVSPS